jgi:DNA processing protein
MISSPENLQAWLRLSLTPGVGNITARALLQEFGQPEAIFERSAAELQALVSKAISQQLRVIPVGLEKAFETTLQWLHNQVQIGTSQIANARVLTLADAEYPSSLFLTPDPPLLLYVLGQTQHLHLLSPPPDKAPRALAVVGSRNPTPQGRLNAHDFAVHLSQAGLTVVSGLALGIDTAAHQGALKGGNAHHPLHTVAVVGTGLDRVYPHQNHALALAIAANGLLISEYPLNTPPITSNFPKRNRLIAGLSQGCLVVEAATRSGSLITAKQALDLGKEVFAIPGSIHTTVSKGCHDLIKQGAKLVDCAQDILEELKDLPHREWHDAPRLPSQLNDTASTAEALLQVSQDHKLTLKLQEHLGQDPVGLDELQMRSGLSASQLQAELFQMELNGALGRLPGGLYQKLNPHR